MDAAHDDACPGDTARNTREQARDTENRILFWLHRFGYLTAAQVAVLVYIQHSQSEAMARRTLLRLEQRGLVLRHKGRIGEHGVYALSLAGARQVFNVHELPATSGKDIVRFPSTHRNHANDTAIRLWQRGWSVYTEREVLTGQAPFQKLGQKVPDTLGVDDEGRVLWVEVEACRRGGRDLKNLATWLVRVAFPVGLDTLTPLDPPRERHYLERVRFVLAVPAARTLAKRLTSALAPLLEPLGQTVQDFAANRLEFEVPGQPLQVGFR